MGPHWAPKMGLRMVVHLEAHSARRLVEEKGATTAWTKDHQKELWTEGWTVVQMAEQMAHCSALQKVY